jgi:unsaturated rhamnogalacturonyl hydrolase
MNSIKNGILALLFVFTLALVGVTRSFAAATLTPATGGGAISADTAGGTPWTSLTGPIVTETVAAQIGTGTIVVSAPSGFEFNISAGTTVRVTGSATPGNNINDLASGSTITPTISASAITISISSKSATTANTLTWQNVQVRPTGGTLASGTLSKSGGAANVPTGNWGTLTEVAGAFAGYKITGTSPTVAGVSHNLTVQKVDQFRNSVTDSTAKTLTFSGLSTIGANAPTIAGSTAAFSTGISVNFTSAGANSTTLGLVAYKVEAATLSVTDGTKTSASGNLALTVTQAAAASVGVETAANGTGTVVPAQDLVSGSSIRVYAVTRDAYGNLANPSSTWSLTGITGGVTSTDLTPTTGASATFTGRQAGSAIIHVVNGAVNSNSGTITVVAGSANNLTFATQPVDALIGTAMANVVVQIRDASSNAVAQSGTAVTLALNGSTLASGTNPQTTDANGRATFNDLVVQQSANNLTFITANDGGLLNVTSATFSATGPAHAYQISAATTTPIVGSNDVLTIRLVDQYGTTVSYSGDKILTFSGPSASPSGVQPTVTDKTGTPRNIGTATTITFANGQSSAGGTLVARNVEIAVLDVVDTEGLGSTTTGGADVVLAVSAVPAALPSQTQILSDMVLANNYFTNNWPNPGCSSCLSGSHSSDIWTRATYFEGSLALWRINQDPAITNYATGWGTFHNWTLRYGATGTTADDQCAGSEYIELYQLAPTQPNRIANIVANLNYWMSTNKINWWWYIDGVHMSGPAFAKMAAISGSTNASYANKMYDYWNYVKSTIGPSHGLYNVTDHLWYRDTNYLSGYKAQDGTTQKCYWSRGNGWVFAGLARILDVLPPSDAHFADYLQTFQEMAAALKAVQRSDGFWNVNLAYANDYPGPESSGTAVFTYGLAWGIHHGYLDAATYLPAVINGWNALANGALHHGADAGFIGYVQSSGHQPADGQPLSYTKAPDFDDFTLGALLLAGSEAYQLTNLSQTITFDSLTNHTYGDAPVTLNATAASGLPVSYIVLSGPASLAGNVLTMTGAGTVTVRAVQAGNTTYGAATNVDQSFTVNPVQLTVTANPQGKVYGDADPALSYQLSGTLVGTDALTGDLSRVAGDDVGTYAIEQGTLAASANYALGFVGAKLTISPKSLTVTANPASKTYGDADPALTYQLTGTLVGTDTLTGSLARMAGEDAGTYAIQQGTLTASANYTLSFVSANLTVTPAATGTTLSSSQNPSPQGSEVTFTATVTSIAPATATPVGNVQFFANGVALGSPVPLSGALALLTTATLPAGTNTVAAVLLEGANFLGSTGSVAQVVSVPDQTPSVLASVLNSDGTLTLSLKGSPKAEYVVQSLENPAMSNWQNTSTNTTDTDGCCSLTLPTTNYNQRFFRAFKP